MGWTGKMVGEDWTAEVTGAKHKRRREYCETSTTTTTTQKKHILDDDKKISFSLFKTNYHHYHHAVPVSVSVSESVLLALGKSKTTNHGAFTGRFPSSITAALTSNVSLPR